MDLQLYDTLTRRKRPFEPLDPARVRVYACGPTVYDFVHLGNGRMAVVFDVLFRLLRQPASQWAASRPESLQTDEPQVIRLDARDAARKAKDFEEADRPRDALAAMGIEIKDSKDGTTWKVRA
jgi:cysteinyl-tRNA synthetase